MSSLQKFLVTILVFFSLATLIFAGDNPVLEKRIEELEAKMRNLDPSFGKESKSISLEDRIKALEERIEGLLKDQSGSADSNSIRNQEEDSVNAPSGLPIQSHDDALPLEVVLIETDQQNTAENEIRLPVAGYMDAHFNKDVGEPGEFDFHRFVLLFGHSFSSRIKFWSEIELEHAFVEGGEPTGELELEQAYLDFLIKPYFNVRAGMLLTPIGIINERHEPPAFNGVERPQVETVIIPSTWFDMGIGATGDLGKGFRYRAYLMGGLDATLFNAEEGIREGRQKGFFSSSRNPAKVVRLEYTGIPSLTIGTSLYSGHTGFNLESTNPRVTIFNVDARYRYDRFGIRGLLAKNWVSRAGQLNIAMERQMGVNPNVASQMKGYYIEPEIHILPKHWRHDLAIFTRYESFNTQEKMPLDFIPLPQFDRSARVLGITYRPVPDVAVKLDYIFNRNASQVFTPRDTVNLGLGWWF